MLTPNRIREIRRRQAGDYCKLCVYDNCYNEDAAKDVGVLLDALEDAISSLPHRGLPPHCPDCALLTAFRETLSDAP